MSSRTADHRVARPLATSTWSTVAFLHWQCPASAIQPRLPRGLVVDEHDGSAWLTITPFVMTSIQPLGRSSLPSRAEIRGTNLRTYVRGPDGRDGLFFLSQDTSSLAFAATARSLLGAPYHWGRMGVEQHDDRVTYIGSRVGSSVSYDITLRLGGPIEPGERDDWLTGRWRAYTQRAGRLVVTPVEHEPWPLRAAMAQRIEQSLIGSVGLAVTGAPLVRFSDGVRHVRNGIPRPL